MLLERALAAAGVSRDAVCAANGPQVVVALGMNAAVSLLGRSITLREVRGMRVRLDNGQLCVATAHPSAILGARDADREAAYGAFVRDLRLVARLLSAS